MSNENTSFIRVQNHDFLEFMRSVLEAANLGYMRLALDSEEYPQTFGGLVYTCKLYQTEVKSLMPPTQVGANAPQTGAGAAKVEVTNPLLPKQADKGQEDANKAAGEPQQKKAGRPTGSSKNPRYDKGLKFGTGATTNP